MTAKNEKKTETKPVPKIATRAIQMLNEEYRAKIQTAIVEVAEASGVDLSSGKWVLNGTATAFTREIET